MAKHASLLPYAETACVNPETGLPLGFERYEYLLAPLRDSSPRVVVQKAAQVGATVMAILRALWFVDEQAAHTMYLFPTHRSAERFSKGRFSVLLERSPYLRGLFKEVQNAGHMRAGVANFYCHGARSRTELMSTPVQYLTLDERDELYLGSPTGRQPWSAVELARQRLTGQRESWELNLSTPTIPGHGIAAEFAESDQHHYHLRCPHCHELAHPTWPEAAEWSVASDQWPVKTVMTEMPKDGTHSLATDHWPPTTAYFRCVLCKKLWSEQDRVQAIHEGQWIAHNPGRAVRGYHLSQLIAPAANAQRLVAQWLACQDHAPARQVFYNAVLGLPYVAEGARLERRFLQEAMARGGYPMEQRSQGSVMGVDVGASWFHVVIAEQVSVVRGPSSVVSGYGQLTTDNGLRLVWVGKLYDWQQLRDLVRRYNVQSYVIDAMPETHQVRQLLQVYPQGHMCFYRGKPTGGNAWASTQGQTIQVSRTESLDAMYLRWRTGNVAVPHDLPSEFMEQMMAMVRVLRLQRDGGVYAEYLPAGGPDHYAHAMNYCELALLLRGGPVRFEVVGSLV